MSPRLLRPTEGGFRSPDADARAYLAAVREADKANLEPAVAKAISDFVIGCKTDGIWDAIKASCILAGAKTLAGALVPLKGTAPTNNNFVSGDYNRLTGLVGNASTKYLDTNRAGNADPQNSFHAAVYGSTLDSGSGALSPLWLGSASASVRAGQLFWYANSYYFNNRRAIAAHTTQLTAFQSSGFVGVTRSSSTAVVGRAKSTDYTFSISSSAPGSEDFFVFANNSAGTPEFYSSARLAFYSIGENIDLALLDTRVSALVTAIGAAI
jgi:hypothetical protein